MERIKEEIDAISPERTQRVMKNFLNDFIKLLTKTTICLLQFLKAINKTIFFMHLLEIKSVFFQIIVFFYISIQNVEDIYAPSLCTIISSQFKYKSDINIYNYNTISAQSNKGTINVFTIVTCKFVIHLFFYLFFKILKTLQISELI